MTWPARVEALRARLGWRAARRLVASRRASAGARVLIVLPAGVSVQRLVAAIDAPVALAVVGEGEAPPGAVRLDSDALNWRGVPTAATRARLWTPDLGAAVSLAPDSLAAAVLVGAAPVGLRIGIDAPETVGFYDLALGAATADPAEALLARLRQITPPLVRLAP